MIKGAVAHRRQYWPFDACLLHALRNADAGPHGHLGPTGVERRVHANDCAAYVACGNHLVLRIAELFNSAVERVVCHAVWTAGAKFKRTWERGSRGGRL